MKTPLTTKTLQSLWNRELTTINTGALHLSRMQLVQDLNEAWMPEGMRHIHDIPDTYWEITARHYNSTHPLSMPGETL